MLAYKTWKQFIQPSESGELEELRRGTVLELAVVVFAVASILIIRAYGLPERLPAPLVLMGGALASLRWYQKDLRLALTWLVGTMMLAIALEKWLFPTGDVQYYFSAIVVVSSLLLSGMNVFLIAGTASAGVLFLARLHGTDWLDRHEVIVPIVLTWMTACAAWIGSRQIRLAFDWMQTSYQRTRDLLEQLRDERASLANTLRMLEDAYVRIEKMNSALIEARSAAEAARQQKAEFAANISHELRTPLNLIIGFSETLANAPETYNGVTWSPALSVDIRRIYRSSRHLSSLIDDILDLSAVQAQRLSLTLQDAPMQDVVSEAVAVLEDLFRAKKLYLRVDVEPALPPVRMDLTRIRQVLINLLTNSSRFTHSGGVTITARQNGQEMEVAVKDTGVGIAARDIPKVFEEFGQVADSQEGSTTFHRSPRDAARVQHHEGTGLGVPLSRRLVEAHGGRMWVESQVGVGTTFYFTLPTSSQAVWPPPAATTDSRIVASNYRKTLLACEPDPQLLHTLRRQLGDYEVIEIKKDSDVAAAVKQHQPIALIVNTLDSDPPAVPVPDDLPVVKIALAGNLRAAHSLGAANYLIKPVLRERLLSAIAELDMDVHDVMIVDDDPELVDLVARMLQSAGPTYRPIKAFGGAHALARLRSEPVDLVLLDLFMPEVDGRMVLQEMRSDSTLAQIPVIVISAQPPELEKGGEKLDIHMVQEEGTFVEDTLKCLRALMEVLPRRGLPTTTGAPT